MSKVSTRGQVNKSLRYIYEAKPDVFDEQWYMLYFDVNINAKADTYMKSNLYDYK